MRRLIYILFMIAPTYAQADFLLESRMGAEGRFFESGPKAELSMLATSTYYYRHKENYFGENQNQSVISTLGLRAQKQSRRGLILDGDLFYSPEEKENYYDVRDLYYETLASGNWRIKTGRVRHLWSRSDEFWQQGLWQPRFLWDELETRSQGLIGLMASGSIEKNIQLTLMVSPIFHPEVSQKYKITEQGQLASVNPWFRPPPPLIELLNEDTSLQTKVDTPAVSEVIFNPGFVAQFLWSNQKRFLSLSYAYKPMNQLYQSLELSSQLREDSNHAEIIVHPEVVYHQLLSVEVGSRSNQWQMGGAVSFEGPSQEEALKERLSQRAQEAMISSVSLSYDFRRVNSKSLQWYSSYMNLHGGDAADEGELAATSSQFERRYQYQSALRTGIKNDLAFNIFKGSVTSLLEVTYDFLQRGSVFSSEIGFKFIENLIVSLRVDALGLLDRKKASVEDGFVRTYRANDRFQLGMNYVF